MAPIASDRYVLQVTIGEATHAKLSHARALLSHAIPSGDLAQVLDRALDALIAQLERRKFSATGKPRRPGASQNKCYVLAHVKRAVWERDGGRCTFVSEQGHRCPARTRLEFDHLDPVARGGRASVSGIRLRCRAHNQFEAERTFGVEFMRHKRQQAREAAAERRDRASAEHAKAAVDEVIPWLRSLGFRAEEARRAAARCESIPEAPLDERVRLALRSLGPRTASRGRAAPASGYL